MAAGFMTHVTCRLTAKNRDQLRGTLRSVIERRLPLPFTVISCTAAYRYVLQLDMHVRLICVIKSTYLLTYFGPEFTQLACQKCNYL